MKLVAYEMGHARHDLQPGAPGRAWMDESPQSYANRCLPLRIANAAGWELRCRSSIEAVWNGGAGTDAISVRVIEQGAGDVPISHFGSGVLTFHVNLLFRTEPGVSLVLTGPPNMPKHGIGALTGMIEADWAHMTATMNWRFTARHCPVRFAIGEPFAFIYPIQRTLIEQAEPVYAPLGSDPDLHARHQQWSAARSSFNAALRVPGSAESGRGWMRDYHAGSPEAVEHRTKLAVRPFQG